MASRSNTGFGQANIKDPNLAMQRQTDNASARKSLSSNFTPVSKSGNNQGRNPKLDRAYWYESPGVERSDMGKFWMRMEYELSRSEELELF